MDTAYILSKSGSLDNSQAIDGGAGQRINTPGDRGLGRGIVCGV